MAADDRHRVCERHAAVRREDTVTAYTCRSCGTVLGRTVFDLGLVPLANEYPASDEESATEQRFPLKARLCEQCWLLQLEETVPPSRLFFDYAYFSSYSDTWMSHAKQFVDNFSREVAARRTESRRRGRFQRRIPSASLRRTGHPGARYRPGGGSVVPAALAAGVPTEVGFFGLGLAERLTANGGSRPIWWSPTTSSHMSLIQMTSRPG